MAAYRTQQEQEWAGEFGDAYTQRNAESTWVARNTAFFTNVVRRCADVGSILEFGANIGHNLAALRCLLPSAELSAIEINASAVEALRALGFVKVYHRSILDFSVDAPRDLVFTKGVLIHIQPESLPAVYERLYASSRRYICIAEYYNPTPVEVAYRGRQGLLFKRDFAGDMLEKYPDLRLVDYGFAYRRDPHFSQDDLTWFLLEKTGGA